MESVTQQKICLLQESFTGSCTNNQHVQKLTESLCEMALTIGDFDVLTKLCVCDVRSNKTFYHKNHFSKFHNRYRAL